jgi:hypothetical protein
MAQPQLIDRYLAALQDNLGQAPDAGDILAEVEDHLRETATRYRHDGLDPHGAEARALEAFGSPRLVARAFADASGTKGLAMPTIFTRRAGLAAIASPLVLLAAMPALFADEWITGRIAVAIARARVLSRVAATLFGTGLLLTAALALRYHLFTPEGEDPIWPYGPMWPSSLIGIAVFGLGLTWLGWQLRSEHPVDTNQGMAPAT